MESSPSKMPESLEHSVARISISETRFTCLTEMNELIHTGDIEFIVVKNQSN